MYKYIGQRDLDGNPIEFFPGIPVGDLTEKQVLELPEELQLLILESAVYKSDSQTTELVTQFRPTASED